MINEIGASGDDNRRRITAEFERAAEGFAGRTRGRFDDLGAVEFSQVRSPGVVAEVGAGTGHFLSLFEGAASRLLALDLTFGMLARARADHPELDLLQCDGNHLPLADGSIDLVCSAQMLHHVERPVPILKEMARVAKSNVLIVDQVATERYEEIAARHALEMVRDPSHAATRPPSAYRIMLTAAGLEILDEKIVEGEQRLSKWMWPGEFPDERIAAVRHFIEEHGHETGMEFRRTDSDDWAFTRRRIMLLASRA
ncbi:MAG: class I SAM-dependent methyltransferase [Actinomycetota bacterium]|nr:class I SAM-dependent methyltransferase [Actinomycetota bacterium]